MSQDFTDNCYQMDHEGPSDLQLIENNFACLKSVFGGTAAPTSPIAGQRWYDFTHKIQRFYDGSDWVCIIPGDTNQKVWSYCNSVVEGMVLVTGIYDMVLALKGGTSSYNVDGGNTAAAWGFLHTHADGSYLVNHYHRHSSGTGTGAGEPEYGFYNPGNKHTGYAGAATRAVTGTSTSAGDTAWRPAAGIGILMKPDL